MAAVRGLQPKGPTAQSAQQPLPKSPSNGVVNRPESNGASKPSTAPGGGSHSSISPQFDMNAVTGTMSLSLPIYTSPTRSSFGPSLILHYDSGLGNGPFGVGWQLSTPSISRKFSKGVPEYTDFDTFVLTGREDLVPDLQFSEPKGATGTVLDGFLVQRYQPRVIAAVERIERCQDISDSNNVFWRTVSGTNVTTIYGDSDQSRIFCVGEDGQKRIFSWLASRSYDSFGNAWEIKYKAENSEGLEDRHSDGTLLQSEKNKAVRSRARYVKSINYGNCTSYRDLQTWKPKMTNNNMQWMFEVVFDYGEHGEAMPTPKEDRIWQSRKFPHTVCRSGFEVRSYRLCRRILMFHHFPEIKRESCLVSSTSFTYFEQEGMELLERFVVKGHVPSQQDGGYNTEELAPIQFQYTKSNDPRQLRLQSTTGDLLHHLNYESGDVRWVDLFGDGAPGILHAPPTGAWTYQRNQMLVQGDESFGPARTLAIAPSSGGRGSMYFEDINHDGHMDMVLLDEEGQPAGYREYQHGTGWSHFTNFANNPNFSIKDGNTRQVDLTGDGFADVIKTFGSNDIHWFQSQAKSGFKAGLMLPCSDAAQHIYAKDPQALITFADMTGDGLADLVEIRDGRVRYWSNCGNGHFGLEIVMSNSPIFATGGSFTTSRLYLTDVNGSGTTDILYLPEGGGAHIYYNFAGDSWGSRVEVPSFPALDSLSSVFAMDLFGSGTSCLCWLGPDPMNSVRNILFYIDLTGPQKPHLLQAYTTNMGTNTTVKYKPSTSFFLEDEKLGTPWRTNLPFPVQCVSEVSVTDEISQTSSVTHYAYHDGFYDGIEREFRGFGFVESRDEETIGIGSSTIMQRPPIHRKAWHYLGTSKFTVEHDKLVQMPKNILPPSQGPAEDLEAIHRALKGRVAREEIYSDDASKNAGIPYQITAYSYEVRGTLLGSGEQNTVYQTLPRETIQHHLERDTTTPRIVRTLVLESDKFGNALKTLTLHCGIETSTLPTERDKGRQETTWASYVENVFTRDFDNADYFHQPQLASTAEYSIANLDKATFTQADFHTDEYIKTLQSIERVPAAQITLKTSRAQKALVKESRTFFYDGKLVERLGAGEVQPYSPVYQQYELAFTAELLSDTFSTENLLRNRTLEDLMQEGGYVQLDKTGSWWSPGVRQMYTSETTDNLMAARTSFYTPSKTRDPFDQETVTSFDKYHFLVESVTDPLKNKTTFENDYVHLQPTLTTDANGNSMGTCYDCFGAPVGTASLGKPDQKIADSLEGFDPLMSVEAMEDFIGNISMDTCRALLRRAGSRTISHHTRFHRGKLSNKVVPSYVAEITSNTYGKVRDSTEQLQVRITYMDGQGKPVQTVNLESVEPETDDVRWLVSGWMINDGRGNLIRECHPTFAATHAFQLQPNPDGIKRTNLLDPLDRVIGTLHPDHTWEKVVQTPWSKTMFGCSHTLDIPDPSADPHVGPFFKSLSREDYFPTWVQMQQEASKFNSLAKTVVEKSLAYKTIPPSSHQDARGLTILETKNPTSGRTLYTQVDFDMAGNPTVQWDERGRQTYKASFDMLGRQMSLQTMDRGRSTTFLDCRGQVRMSSDPRRTLLRHDYDALGRETDLWMPDGKTPTKGILLHRKEYGESLTGSDAFNLRGHIYRITDQSGIRINENLDMKGNCLAESFSLATEYRDIQDVSKGISIQGQPYLTRRKFDALGRLVALQNAQKQVVSTSYNLSGQVQSIRMKETANAADKVIIKNVAYTADGKQQEVNFGNRTTVRSDYDGSTRILKRRILRRDSGAVIQDLNYVHDCLKRIIYKTDAAIKPTYFRNAKVEPTWEYTYDAIGRLIQSSGKTALNLNGKGSYQLTPYNAGSTSNANQGNGQEMCNYLEQYTYDDAGNMTAMQQEPTGDIGITGWKRTFTYNCPSRIDPKVPNNCLSECQLGDESEPYGVDDRGCTVKMPGFSSLKWDFQSRLRSSSKQIVGDEMIPETTYYVYNSEGDRVRKVTERSGSASSPGTTTRLKDTVEVTGVSFYATFTGDGITKASERITSEVGLSESVVFLAEINGLSGTLLPRFTPNQNLELDDTGQLVSYEEFSAFGSATYTVPNSDIDASRKYRFASYQRDSETGLYFCKARYLAPWLGRWLSPDPLLFADGLHLYAYVGNDPVNSHDPTGTTKRTFVEALGKAWSLEDPNDKAGKTDKKFIVDRSQVNQPVQPDDLTKQTAGNMHAAFRRPAAPTTLKEVIPHAHHLYGDTWKQAFFAAGIGSNQLTVMVDPSLNLIQFKETHDKPWNKYMENVKTDAYNSMSKRELKGAAKYREKLAALKAAKADPEKYRAKLESGKKRQFETGRFHAYIKENAETLRPQMHHEVINHLTTDQLTLYDMAPHMASYYTVNKPAHFSVAMFTKAKADNVATAATFSDEDYTKVTQHMTQNSVNFLEQFSRHDKF